MPGPAFAIVLIIVFLTFQCLKWARERRTSIGRKSSAGLAMAR
jgi:hypothetical protein